MTNEELEALEKEASTTYDPSERYPRLFAYVRKLQADLQTRAEVNQATLAHVTRLIDENERLKKLISMAVSLLGPIADNPKTTRLSTKTFITTVVEFLTEARK